jgi:catechol 2,3-dioxygenase-like lactoylglutathione lyase family enzyme
MSTTTFVLDCPDPLKLATFYSALMDWELVYESKNWATVKGGPDWQLGFQLSPEYRAPTWPSPDVQQMAHLDFDVTDRPAMHAKALSLGATVLDDNRKNFTVYADPDGHPFCLCD